MLGAVLEKKKKKKVPEPSARQVLVRTQDPRARTSLPAHLGHWPRLLLSCLTQKPLACLDPPLIQAKHEVGTNGYQFVTVYQLLARVPSIPPANALSVLRQGLGQQPTNLIPSQATVHSPQTLISLAPACVPYVSRQLQCQSHSASPPSAQATAY